MTMTATISDRLPQLPDAVALAESHFGAAVEFAARFPTGLCHWVYDMRLADGRKIVVRLAMPGNRMFIAGGIHWSDKLRPLGVPLPTLLHGNSQAEPFPYMILHRLPGEDLGDVYTTLKPEDRRKIAFDLAGIQMRVGQTSPGRGFGFAHAAEGPFAHSTWRDMLESYLSRSRQWMMQAGVVNPEWIDRARKHLDLHQKYLAAILPKPFLDDITTKNVLIHENKLSGIVDVDTLCYGDALYHVALIQMALLSRGWPLDYVAAWREAMNVSPQQQAVLSLYTALHGVAFLSEFGQKFNRSAANDVNPQNVEVVADIVTNMLKAAAG